MKKNKDTQFTLRGGVVRGKKSRQTSRNCQDGMDLQSLEISGKRYWIGFVSDGCGSGQHTEVAAILLSKFAVLQVIRLLKMGAPVKQIPVILYPEAVKFLESLRLLFPYSGSYEVVKFIENHLLATLMGFVINVQEGVLMYAGDGCYQINDKEYMIDYGNRSPYLAYHLVPKSVLVAGTGNLPTGFQVIHFATKRIQRIVIATDGFNERAGLIQRLVNESSSGELGVQLWMNFINGPRNSQPEKGVFLDDAAAIQFERG
jgi:hypothetical protein